jgi:uncharacterized membrane protein
MYTSTYAVLTEPVAITMEFMWECEIAAGRSVAMATALQKKVHRSGADHICGRLRARFAVPRRLRSEEFTVPGISLPRNEVR